MDKPFTLKIQETEKKIVEIINSSQFPAFVLKQILQGIYNEIDKVDMEEIQKYQEENKKRRVKNNGLYKS